MKIEPKLLLEFQTLALRQRGVFSVSDLANYFLTSTALALNRKLAPFLQSGILYHFCRGFYVAQDFSLEWLSQRICPKSAISFGSVLAKNLLIGSIPEKTVYAVKIGKSRIYRSPVGQVVHLGFSHILKKRIWFGYDSVEQGICYADKEKAFLDTLYFYQSGQKFSFNIYSDIHLDLLDQKKIEEYLKRYRNPKFVKFVEGVLNGEHTE